MKAILEVEFLLERDDMTDEEYHNQEFKTILITEDMIIELVEKKANLKEGERLCEQNFFIKKL